MGERDPNLQSFIRARAKNQIEDAKLRKSLAELEMGRRLSKSLINTELFEDRKAAFELKQEARKLEQSRRREERTARRLVTVLATQTGGPEGGPGGEGGGDKLNLAKLSTCSPRKPLWSARGASSDPLPASSASAARLSDAVEAAEKEEQFGVDGSGLVLPTIRRGRSRSESRGSEGSDLWPGRPEAIGSVRRPRRKPEEMLAAFRAGEDARRLVRETSRTCSRQCNKPDYVLELERMYGQLPDLVPAIRVAREVLSAREDDRRGGEDKEKEKEKEDKAAKVSLPPAPRSAGARPATRDSSSFKMAASARDSARMRLAAKVSQALMEDLAKDKEEEKSGGKQQQPGASHATAAAATPKTPAIYSGATPAINSARTDRGGKRCRKPTPFKFPRNSILREMPAA